MEKTDKTPSKDVIGSVLVVGGGIAGIQAALDLANSGYYVYMTEKEPAIGGIMAKLDKTFPTNDCSMCVISPKLVECGRHLNIDLMTLTEVEEVTGSSGNFEVKLKKKARYIDLDKCTACGECVKVCPIETPNLFDEGLREKKAIFKLYPQGMPSAYSIEKRSTAPCKVGCPAHVSIQGYIALISDGRYSEALALFKKEHPFPGICGRVCHHPCELECTRNDLDQSVAIRDMHRFLADYEIQSGKKYVPEIKAEIRTEKVAIIGSGPAGLTAAYHLLKKGYKVSIFEKMPEPGGMMRYGIPEYRLPRDIIDTEIATIEEMGAEVKCGVVFGKDVTLDTLKAEDYVACFLSIGLHGGRPLGIENERTLGVIQGVDFLRDVAMEKEVSLGERVIVVGGGNVAIDVALTAKRKGAKTVTLVCLEKRDDMPAWEHEIEEAIEGEIEIVNGFGPKIFHINEQKHVSGIQFRMCTEVLDSAGRFNPKYDDNMCETYSGDTVIVAIGQSADLKGIKEQGIAISSVGGLEADPITLQTPIDWVFAGGDVFYGPKSVVDAVCCGKEAAESIHRFVNNIDLLNDRERVWDFTRPDVTAEVMKPRVQVKCREPKACECNFLEVSYGYNEEEVRIEADRCLKCGVCSECYQCVDVCLAEAIDHNMVDEDRVINVGAVIVASGFTPFDPSEHKTYGYSSLPNVITSLEFERILSASGPFAGHMVRPSDNKEPSKIAWLQCVGSRDINLSDHSYCSSVCCMYSNKQAIIAKEHSKKPLDTAIFFMDMRTCGKDFEKYYMRAKYEKGVRYIRSRVHTIDPVGADDLRLRYVTEYGEIVEEIFDMVVLAIGLAPSKEALNIAKIFDIDLNDHMHASTRTLSPVSTTKDGIFVCGAFQEPKDIPHSVMEASATAASATKLLASARGSMIRTKELPPELDVSAVEPRVGVFVCNCGINIGGVADISKIKKYVATLPYVVHVEDNLFTCSQDTQDNIKEVIKEFAINRVVVASCSPRTHEPLFQETVRDAGLNKYLFEMANIRDQNTWVHINDPDKATEKAKDLVRMAVAKVVWVAPLHQVRLEVVQKVLVIGGGVAGMESALGVAEQGLQVYLIESTSLLGGVALKLRSTWQGEDVKPYLENLIEKVKSHPKIELFLNTEAVETTGIIGNFTTILMTSASSIVSSKIQHGATVLATGGKEYVPNEYLYGDNPNVLTHFEFDEAISNGDSRIENNDSVVFIQCVGSRNDERPYCSKLCCTHTLKSALALKSENSDLDVYVLYRDMRSYGFREALYKEAREKGIIFMRYDLEQNQPIVKSFDNNKLSITLKDHVLQLPVEINPKLLILATAVIPNENRNLFELFKVPVNAEGFLVEAHAKLRPVDFSSEGLFMAGLAHYPKPLDESIAQAKASVSRVMTILSKDSIMVGGVVAEVDSDRCAVCLTCVRTCPYNIPFVGVDGHATIEAAECHGCGSCASECPGKAIQLKHFTDKQTFAKIDALFNE